MEKLQDQDSLREILLAVMNIRAQKTVIKPVFLKISPDLTFGQIDEVIALYTEVGLDGIIATNTTTDRNCLSRKIRSVWSGRTKRQTTGQPVC